MRRLAPVAALAALAIAVPLSFGSSHREAPLTSIDPTADDTDVYAYTAKDAPGSLTVVANWVPFEDPAGGPNFYRFDDNARLLHQHRQHRRRRPDVRYRFKFKTSQEHELVPVRVGQPVDSIDNPKLNAVQTYAVTAR